MEKVVIGDNVYYNSTPKEFKRFMEFLENAEPYDIVIDGLNVACFGTPDKDSKERARRVSLLFIFFIDL